MRSLAALPVVVIVEFPLTAASGIVVFGLGELADDTRFLHSQRLGRGLALGGRLLGTLLQRHMLRVTRDTTDILLFFEFGFGYEVVFEFDDHGLPIHSSTPD